jgi:hypothetical protein
LSIGAAAPIDNKKLLFHIGKGGAADREAFADFLDEASLILDRPELKEVSLKFRASAMAWEALAKALLPDDVSQFREARDLSDGEAAPYFSRERRCSTPGDGRDR